jgi:hypothetical protein
MLEEASREFPMKATRCAQLIVIACVTATAQPGSAEEGKPSAPARAGADAPKDAPGMKAFIDPQTGGFVREPPPGTAPLVLSPAESNALSTSHQGLVEVPSTVPGGGFKVDLQGRFQSPLTATVGPDGKVTIQHQHADSPSGDKK